MLSLGQAVSRRHRKRSMRLAQAEERQPLCFLADDDVSKRPLDTSSKASAVRARV